MLSFMLNHTLVAWIGNTDLRAVLEVAEVGPGPVAQALATGRFDRALLLCNYPRARSRDYLAWLESRVSIAVDLVLQTAASDSVGRAHLMTLLKGMEIALRAKK